MNSRLGLFSALFLVACGGTTTGTSDGPDAGSGTDSGVGTQTCIGGCLGSDLTWGPNGGLASTQPSSTVTSCTSYVHAESGSSGDLSCTDTLAQSCGGATIGSGEIAGAFLADDVKAAFAGTTTLFGSDPRGCDGAVEQITYSGKTIDIGGDCKNASSCGTPTSACVPVTAGLSALTKLLLDLDAQELKTPKCASVFPGR